MARSFLLALLALTLCLTSAVPAPAPQNSLVDLLLHGLPKGADSGTLARRSSGEGSALQKRGRDQNYFHSALPNCSEDDDPSYAFGKSAYRDGEGTLVKSALCNNGKDTKEVFNGTIKAAMPSGKVHAIGEYPAICAAHATKGAKAPI
ncbi:hypothetical protein EAF04_001929 [Stromatinia cepivora]|nr:hypothetical protein EAF04_001929 [Stromatinia cepivora]